MPESSHIVITRLAIDRLPSWGADRRAEPVTVGVPIARGVVVDADDLGLVAHDETPRPLQARALDRWPDGSIRWVLLDFQVDVPGDAGGLRLMRRGTDVGRSRPSGVLEVTSSADGAVVAAGTSTFEFRPGGTFPFSAVSTGGKPSLDAARSGLRIRYDGRDLFHQVSRVTVVESGPLRAEVEIDAVAGDRPGGWPVDVRARVEMFAGSDVVRVHVTLRNTRRAVHPGGQWPLGDPGSVLLEAAEIVLARTEPIAALRCAPEIGVPATERPLPFGIRQESSGGDWWNGRIHVDRHGRVPLRFRGYDISAGGATARGLRALPVVSVSSPAGTLTATMPEFWQQFPRSIEVHDASVILGLFPAGTPDGHELQGGEQKTHTLIVAFAAGLASEPPLAWCHDPVRVTPPPDYLCATGAVPYLEPVAPDEHATYARLVACAHDTRTGFLAKRERADEFGWRHFGDLPADHESAFQPPDAPFVSHYNNQYDGIACFALHFMRTGDRRWWDLMSALARHVRDIDIYRTREDKPLYNGGLFWHTDHYVDAGTSTHRTYPRGGKSGGGPSAEHNYNQGLMLHYFLTGERDSRDAAVGLGEWVLRMDDGRLTPFRWLSRAPTGWATYTAGHQGPGRGAGHSILACLVAHRLTGDPQLLEKAEELIRRTAHPADVISPRYVEDVEGYWSYTAFLQALGVYLDGKHERGEFDRMYAWARGVLLAFARWMAVHERPYLDHPDGLEYPNQTWAAQDLRKADVFFWAALHTEGQERATFLERADWFFDHATTQLSSMDGYSSTRPIVLVLGQGLRRAWFARRRTSLPEAAPEPTTPLPGPVRFVPQRVQAERRAILLLAAGAVTCIGLVIRWLM